MRRHLVFTVILVTGLILLFGNYTYAGDWTITASERGTGRYAKCVGQEFDGKKVVICSEGNFVLGPKVPIGTKLPLPVEEPRVMLPVKKPIPEPSSPLNGQKTTKPTHSNPFIDAILRGQRARNK